MTEITRLDTYGDGGRYGWSVVVQRGWSTDTMNIALVRRIDYGEYEVVTAIGPTGELQTERVSADMKAPDFKIKIPVDCARVLADTLAAAFGQGNDMETLRQALKIERERVDTLTSLLGKALLTATSTAPPGDST